MNIISNKNIKEIEQRLNDGVRSVVVEGKSDTFVYERIYKGSVFINAGGCSNAIKIVRHFNSEYGKTPLVAAVIDKDNRKKAIISALEEEHIFTLKVRSIEVVFLVETIIKNLYGKYLFQEFSNEIRKIASSKTDKKIANYSDALDLLIRKAYSKEIISMLIYYIGEMNKSNSRNIEFLCQRMDATNSWYLVEHFFPKICAPVLTHTLSR